MNADQVPTGDVIDQMIADGSWVKLLALLIVVAIFVAAINIYHRSR